MSRSLHDAPQNNATEPSSIVRTVGIGKDRRWSETVLLACIALLEVWWLRFRIEPLPWISAESITIVVLLVLSIVVARRHGRIPALAAVAAPAIYAFASRGQGAAIAFEMTAITCLGVAALVMALFSRSRRLSAISLVASGFLVLFTTFISDAPSALLPALAWMSLCLWHLVANHWEKVTACSPREVRRSMKVRPLTVAVGLLLFISGALAFRGRFADPNQFGWGIMPTSGGSSWSDPGARSGVGTGDAAIAAKDHAESFGAVDSDMFLESTGPTLYDMFSDSIGEPKLKRRRELAQALSSQNLITSHERSAKSERGGETFTTSRTKPRQHMHLKDAMEPAILQWVGPTGVRLGVNRYDRFDGVVWSREQDWKKNQLSSLKVEDETWFFDPSLVRRMTTGFDDFKHAGVLKILRLDSTHVPSPTLTAGVHIRDIEMDYFFGIDRDGSFYMPQRKKIPPLTVVHFAATRVSEDELIQDDSWIRASTEGPGASDPLSASSETEGQRRVRKLAVDLTDKVVAPHAKLQAMVGHLRNHFVHDRQANDVDSDDPLRDFLVNRRGGDHLFATALALMAREVGMPSRLVSGFYVRPDSYEVSQGHASVMANDVHAWAEIQLADGRWIAVEPTPGYEPPHFRPSFWLQAKRFALRNWPYGAAAAALLVLLYLGRVICFEILAWSVWIASHLLPDRQRVQVLLWILQRRASLAGQPRHTGTPQRDWLLSMTSRDQTLAEVARSCCDAADRMTFGQQRMASDWTDSADVLVRAMTTRYMSRAARENATTMGVSS